MHNETEVGLGMKQPQTAMSWPTNYQENRVLVYKSLIGMSAAG